LCGFGCGDSSGGASPRKFPLRRTSTRLTKRVILSGTETSRLRSHDKAQSRVSTEICERNYISSLLIGFLTPESVRRCIFSLTTVFKLRPVAHTKTTFWVLLTSSGNMAKRLSSKRRCCKDVNAIISAGRISMALRASDLYAHGPHFQGKFAHDGKHCLLVSILHRHIRMRQMRFLISLTWT
jgi:hypothetical protein